MQLTNIKILSYLIVCYFSIGILSAQFTIMNDSILDSLDYKKRVLENTEISLLSSMYAQDGDNAATSGGIGSEELMDITPTIVVSVPLNDDDVLTIDAGISAYTSASSSNINPFDSDRADAFQASSGASAADVWGNFTGIYSHSSDDRNNISSGKLSVSAEYDYFSVGLGGGKAWLFNEKNTEFSIHTNIYIDFWNTVYPIEFRSGGSKSKVEDDGTVNVEDDDDDHFNIKDYQLTGDTNYSPMFSPFKNKGRNSYSVNLGFSQILSKKAQILVVYDVTIQQGLLSTPFHRIHFKDYGNTFIEGYHLADAIETLPNNRLKMAGGVRLNYYLNKTFVLRNQYRYYQDDWGVSSHTYTFELPTRIRNKLTFIPSYRYYIQSASDYFAPYNTHLSSEEFYTSDYDLSEFTANQFGFGISYTDTGLKHRIWKLKLKSIDFQVNKYDRNTSFSSAFAAFAFKFILD
jgi:hypothetical protein